jgi:hypothetical protein
MGYELLDDDLTKSTLWMFGTKDAKLLFVTILAECHGSDICRVPIPVLFKLTGLTPTEGVEALIELCNADPDSKCQAEGGARIVQIVDEIGKGLFLPSYRGRRNRYLTKNRVAELRRREEEKKAISPKRALTRNAALRSVTPGNALEAEAEAEKEKKGGSRASRPALPDVLAFAKENGISEKSAERFRLHHKARGWKGIVDWKPALLKWAMEDAEKGKASEPKPTGSGNPHVNSLAKEELDRVFGRKPEQQREEAERQQRKEAERRELDLAWLAEDRAKKPEPEKPAEQPEGAR